MVQFSLLAALSLLSGAFGSPLELVPKELFLNYRAPANETRDLERRQGGYYFQNWSEGGSNIRCGNGAGGLYTAQWNSRGGFVCGKGWNPAGGARCVPHHSFMVSSNIFRLCFTPDVLSFRHQSLVQYISDR
jgi:endo-1,4-beta-xylanase